MFSGAGKNGPETGLQYSVRLNQATMDSLLLKVTPMKGHGINVFLSTFTLIPLSANPTKWSNTLKQFDHLFDHFVGLMLKELIANKIPRI